MYHERSQELIGEQLLTFFFCTAQEQATMFKANEVIFLPACDYILELTVAG